MELQIMTRLGATCFTHLLRDSEATALENEIKGIVKWFIDSVPPDLRGRTDTRILVEHDGKQVFQFTMDYYEDKQGIEQEMNRFAKSLEDLWKVESP